MRYLSCALVLSLVSILAAGQTEAHPAADFQSVVHLFDYDAKQALDSSTSMTRSSKSSATVPFTTLPTPVQRAVRLRHILLSRRERAHLRRCCSATGAMVPAQNSFRKPRFTQEPVQSLSSPTTHGSVPNLGIKHWTISINQNWTAKSKFKRSWIFAGELTCCSRGPMLIRAARLHWA